MPDDQPGPADLPRHPIAVVARRTGLSPDVLRVWERRYGVAAPGRSADGQRIYSDADVARLRLLGEAVAGGRRIGGIATLPLEALERLVADDRPPAAGAGEPVGDDALLARALDRVRALDAPGLDALLRRHAAAGGVPAALEEVVVPLLRRIGDDWHAGRLSIAAEHLASAVVESYVVGALRSLPADEAAPLLVAAAPTGTRHSIAPALVAAAAAAEGWRVLHLGADLPVAEIASAAAAGDARAVALSVAYTEAPARLLDDLRALRAALPAEVAVLAGGAAVQRQARAIGALGVVVGSTLDDLRAALRDARPD